jgi:hypothetical protein
VSGLGVPRRSERLAKYRRFAHLKPLPLKNQKLRQALQATCNFEKSGAAALAAVLALERVRRRFSNASRLISGNQRHPDEVLPTSARDVSKPTPADSSDEL